MTRRRQTLLNGDDEEEEITNRLFKDGLSNRWFFTYRITPSKHKERIAFETIIDLQGFSPDFRDPALRPTLISQDKAIISGGGALN
jgi:hypothetical protein